MVSALFYRNEANRCRTLARSTNDAESSKRWKRIAAEYESLAREIEAIEAKEGPRQTLHVPMQQQPMQQQQAKSAPTVVVRKSLQEGYHWRVVAEGQTVETGAAATELEARNAANLVVERIAKTDRPHR
jgi:hypothetical protein